ncbi:MAG: hypothetical protein A3G25_04675 [Betaproteobacteria bacterium RIFCSPLOWO2_12_FULL_63_13]|nr:MAG: hypothetical protein A3H32_10150 [Betaproteobacteria bacterium RIFCSPLOWO2_02_FULL_63_19]OGA45538.1 MAG: hypothetical protein A3G25_04675 [Betaproteobacteria bacterium RIFCSPLOWO2_12_FULL_63_13]
MPEEIHLHSKEEIRAYVRAELERQFALKQKQVNRWRLAKRTMWLLLLAAGYLQFSLIDVMYEMLSLPAVQVSVPAAKPPQKKSGI